MSAIFKTRKIPKHLIIRNDYETRGRSRFSLFRVVLFVGVLILLTSVVAMMGDYSLPAA